MRCQFVLMKLFKAIGIFPSGTKDHRLDNIKMMAATSPKDQPVVPAVTAAIKAAPVSVLNATKDEQHVDATAGSSQERDSLHVYPHNKRSEMSAVLDTRELWKQFDALGTEMIVTRRGRRMFPPIKVELHNLNPNSFYVLLMDLAPVDKFRYKYQNSRWVKCFEEACAPTRLYIHPESPALGSYWMDHIVSFYKLKLTNNQLDKQGHIIVNSMHCYQPRLHIVESSDRRDLNWENFHTITFPGTQFTTVTAYQNDKITQLKIENNPFAKGFRQPMSRNRSRPIKFSYPPRSGSETGSDDGIVQSSNPIVCPSQADICASNEHHRLKLKRSSSGSDDETSIKKIPREENESLIKLTPQLNPFLTTPVTTTVASQLSTTAPFYVFYGDGSSSTPMSQAAHTLVPSHQTAITSLSPATTIPAFQIVHINAPPTSVHHHNGIISAPFQTTAVTPAKRSRSNRSSSESSDSESDCDQASPPQPSPPLTGSIIQTPPPPLISAAGGLTSYMTIPTGHQNIIFQQSPAAPVTSTSTHRLIATAPVSNAGGHGNGMSQHAATQQILVPITAFQGKLLQAANGSIVLSSYPSTLPPTSSTAAIPGNATVETGKQPFLQTLPFIVSGKQDLSAAKAAIGGGANGQGFQLLALPGGTTHQIVDQAH